VGELRRFTVPAFGIGAAALWWAGRGVMPKVRRARRVKLGTYVVIVHGVLLATICGQRGVGCSSGLARCFSLSSLASAVEFFRRRS
jgi:hypothetical protein